MPRQSDAREKMIQSAALLFREHGVGGTSFADVLEHSGAPRGSVYHHFPDGKRQLALETTRFAGDFIAAGIVAALEGDDPVAGIRTFGAGWVKALRKSGYEAGCPVAAAAISGDEAPEARDAAGTVFKGWERLIADALVGHGVPRKRARSAATLTIAAIEGAVIMARAQRSAAPLQRVVEELTEVAEATIASATEGEHSTKAPVPAR